MHGVTIAAMSAAEPEDETLSVLEQQVLHSEDDATITAMSAAELEDEMFSILKQQVLQSEDGAGIAALNMQRFPSLSKSDAHHVNVDKMCDVLCCRPR